MKILRERELRCLSIYRFSIPVCLKNIEKGDCVFYPLKIYRERGLRFPSILPRLSTSTCQGRLENKNECFSNTPAPFKYRVADPRGVGVLTIPPHGLAPYPIYHHIPHQTLPHPLFAYCPSLPSPLTFHAFVCFCCPNLLISVFNLLWGFF